MTANTYAEAVEAAAQAMLPSKCLCRACINPARRHAEAAVAAATPHLLAPVRALHRREQERFYPWRTTCTEDGEDWPCCTTRMLDAIESEVTSEETIKEAFS